MSSVLYLKYLRFSQIFRSLKVLTLNRHLIEELKPFRRFQIKFNVNTKTKQNISLNVKKFGENRGAPHQNTLW